LALKHVVEYKSSSSLKAADIQYALELYDQTRRPHATRLLNIVHSQVGQKAPLHASSEEEDRALIARMKNRPDLTWLSEHDVGRAFAEVLAAKEEHKDGQRAKLESSLSQSYQSRL
jgi:salicylate hydroxylase